MVSKSEHNSSKFHEAKIQELKNFEDYVCEVVDCAKEKGIIIKQWVIFDKEVSWKKLDD